MVLWTHVAIIGAISLMRMAKKDKMMCIRHWSEWLIPAPSCEPFHSYDAEPDAYCSTNQVSATNSPLEIVT